MNDTVLIVGEIILGIALLTALTAVLTVWATRMTTKRSALEILHERYARGELSHEQYELVRRDVELDSVSSAEPRPPLVAGLGPGTAGGTRRAT